MVQGTKISELLCISGTALRRGADTEALIWAHHAPHAFCHTWFVLSGVARASPPSVLQTAPLMLCACTCPGVWWFPPLVLQTAAFALAACLGVLVYMISYFAWRHEDQAKAVRPQCLTLGLNPGRAIFNLVRNARMCHQNQTKAWGSGLFFSATSIIASTLACSFCLSCALVPAPTWRRRTLLKHYTSCRSCCCSYGPCSAQAAKE